MKYTVSITETLRRNIEVEADRAEEASDIVWKQYLDGKHVLDASDHMGINVVTRPTTRLLRLNTLLTNRNFERLPRNVWELTDGINNRWTVSRGPQYINFYKNGKRMESFIRNDKACINYINKTFGTAKDNREE